jgi:hypothetical protein
MKLELKDIVGYLPYALMIKDTKRNIALTTTGAYFSKNKDTSFKFMLLNGWGIIDSEECKPILRPLSDLTKEIEVNGEKFVPIDELNDCEYIKYYLFNNNNTDFLLADIPDKNLQDVLEGKMSIYDAIAS